MKCPVFLFICLNKIYNDLHSTCLLLYLSLQKNSDYLSPNYPSVSTDKHGGKALRGRCKMKTTCIPYHMVCSM